MALAPRAAAAADDDGDEDDSCAVNAGDGDETGAVDKVDDTAEVVDTEVAVCVLLELELVLMLP
jgi:hypothetical protein